MKYSILLLLGLIYTLKVGASPLQQTWAYEDYEISQLEFTFDSSQLISDINLINNEEEDHWHDIKPIKGKILNHYLQDTSNHFEFKKVSAQLFIDTLWEFTVSYDSILNEAWTKLDLKNVKFALGLMDGFMHLPDLPQKSQWEIWFFLKFWQCSINTKSNAQCSFSYELSENKQLQFASILRDEKLNHWMLFQQKSNYAWVYNSAFKKEVLSKGKLTIHFNNKNKSTHKWSFYHSKDTLIGTLLPSLQKHPHRSLYTQWKINYNSGYINLSNRILNTANAQNLQAFQLLWNHAKYLFSAQQNIHLSYTENKRKIRLNSKLQYGNELALQSSIQWIETIDKISLSTIWNYSNWKNSIAFIIKNPLKKERIFQIRSTQSLIFSKQFKAQILADCTPETHQWKTRINAQIEFKW